MGDETESPRLRSSPVARRRASAAIVGLAAAVLTAALSSDAGPQPGKAAKPARTPPAGAAGEPSGWSRGNRVVLNVADSAGNPSPSYTYFCSRSGDIRIEIQDPAKKPGSSGELLLVSGRFLASRGIVLAKGYEIDQLDAAILSWQLVGLLLDRGAPGDPEKIGKPVGIQVVERREALTVSTTSGEQTFPPPWTVTGRAYPVGAGRIFFEISFRSKTMPIPGGSPDPTVMRYSGTWERVSPPPEILDSARLDGWTLYSLGPYRRSTSRGPFVDYGATPVTQRYSTVGDLRRAASAGK